MKNMWAARDGDAARALIFTRISVNKVFSYPPLSLSEETNVRADACFEMAVVVIWRPLRPVFMNAPATSW